MKLTDDQKIEARALRAQGLTYAKIAARYHVTPSTIYRHAGSVPHPGKWFASDPRCKYCSCELDGCSGVSVCKRPYCRHRLKDDRGTIMRENARTSKP